MDNHITNSSITRAQLCPEHYLAVTNKIIKDSTEGYNSEYVAAALVKPLEKAGVFEEYVSAAGVLRDAYTDFENLNDFERESAAMAIRDLSKSVVGMFKDPEFWETPTFNNAAFACIDGIPHDVVQDHCEAIYSYGSEKDQYLSRIAELKPEVVKEVAGVPVGQFIHNYNVSQHVTDFYSTEDLSE